ncbi:hypothetical protein RJT34_08800 [Clitoria ternatea]|uniref:Uncharacterized protein n=1 Tax=Clitoria ternatea TaxID=43366 RepID=A0AAN9K495_CLITE
MDAVLTSASNPNNKQTRTMKPPRKNVRGNFISNHSENFDNTYAGLLNPPSRAMSLPYSNQPPLLPLPTQQQPLLSSQSMPFPKNRTTMSLKKRAQSVLIVAPNNTRWGPDPKHLPKHVPVGLTSKVVVQEKEDMVFNLAPPPSSLPLPKFSLRPKLSCNAEAAGDGGGVDAGATNNLRRLLRLR